jgi:hypothetical protein
MRLVPLALALLSWANPAAFADSGANQARIMAARSQSNADEATVAQLASLMQTWSAAAAEFAHQVGSAVPWNESYTQTPIQYAPMYLYAGPGGASACHFPGGPGKSLKSLPAVFKADGARVPLDQPVNLAGLTLDLSRSDSEQAKAYQAAIGAPNTFFPKNPGGPFNGTYCAAVAYNQPAAKQFQIVTWYAPSASAMQATLATKDGGATSLTPQMLLSKAGQLFANAVRSSPLGGSVQPIYKVAGVDNGVKTAWAAQVRTPGTQVFSSIDRLIQSVVRPQMTGGGTNTASTGANSASGGTNTASTGANSASGVTNTASTGPDQCFSVVMLGWSPPGCRVLENLLYIAGSYRGWYSTDNFWSSYYGEYWIGNGALFLSYPSWY